MVCVLTQSFTVSRASSTSIFTVPLFPQYHTNHLQSWLVNKNWLDPLLHLLWISNAVQYLYFLLSYIHKFSVTLSNTFSAPKKQHTVFFFLSFLSYHQGYWTSREQTHRNRNAGRLLHYGIREGEKKVERERGRKERERGRGREGERYTRGRGESWHMNRYVA